LAIVVTWAGVARAEAPDLTLRKDPAEVGRGVTSGPPLDITPVPWGFYRDRQGRVMQVSFDLGRRVWLGVAYAPQRRLTGEMAVAPAAFEFGASYERLSDDGLTRYRLHVLDGEALVHPSGLEVTAVRFDLSHRYTAPLLRITTFFGEPARHDFYPNVGFFFEALHLERAPRGIDGEQALTLGNAHATLDLWRSGDMRSYVRLRAGPGVQQRFRSWAARASDVVFFPQAALDGNLIVGKREFQQLTFRLRGGFLRSVSWDARTLPGNWIADAEAAYEVVLLAINDQPVSLRFAGVARGRDDATVEVAAADIRLPEWEWQGTAGFRISFFSPPVPPRGATP
jgi:hypothetical protein